MKTDIQQLLSTGRLPFFWAEEVAEQLSISDIEMAKLLCVSIRTYHRMKPDGLLSVSASERLLLLKDVIQQLSSQFENMEIFALWLKSPIAHLDFIAPIQLLATIKGILYLKNWFA